MNKEMKFIKSMKIYAVILIVIIAALFAIYATHRHKENIKASTEALIREGDELKNSGKYAEAEAKYEEALATSKNNINLLKDLGTVYLSQKKYAEASDTLQKAADADSTDTFTLNNLANAYRNSGDNDRAIEYYKLSYEKGNLDSLKNLVTLLNIKGEYDQSIDYLNKAISANPTDDSLKKILQSTEYKKTNNS